MVKCANCGALVQEGKFCEKCGSSLTGAAKVQDGFGNGNITKNSNMQAVGSFFDNIKNNVNKTAADLMSIKSNYANDTIIYMTNQVPNIKEKKIRVNSDETLYFNFGSGFEKHNESFTTELNAFYCYFIKNDTLISNSFQVDISTKIKNASIDEPISLLLQYNFSYKPIDVDKFFNKMMSIKPKSWKKIEIGAFVVEEVKQIIKNSIDEMLIAEGGIDLRNVEEQLGKYSDVAVEKVNIKLKEYELVSDICAISNVEKNYEEIAKVLIKNLYM